MANPNQQYGAPHYSQHPPDAFKYQQAGPQHQQPGHFHSGPSQGAQPAPAAVYPLAPLSRQAGVFPNWIARQPITLVLKEKILSWSGEDIYINDINGVPVFRLAGKVMSISKRKSFSDAAGNLLFTLRQEIFSIMRHYYAEGPQDERFLEVKGKFSVLHKKFEASFVDSATHEKIELAMKGDLWDYRSEIKMGEQVVAVIDRQILNKRDLLFNRDTYAVTIAPGFDITVAMAMAISLDEERHGQ